MVIAGLFLIVVKKYDPSKPLSQNPSSEQSSRNKFLYKQPLNHDIQQIAEISIMDQHQQQFNNNNGFYDMTNLHEQPGNSRPQFVRIIFGGGGAGEVKACVVFFCFQQTFFIFLFLIIIQRLIKKSPSSSVFVSFFEVDKDSTVSSTSVASQSFSNSRKRPKFGSSSQLKVIKASFFI